MWLPKSLPDIRKIPRAHRSAVRIAASPRGAPGFLGSDSEVVCWSPHRFRGSQRPWFSVAGDSPRSRALRSRGRGLVIEPPDSKVSAVISRKSKSPLDVKKGGGLKFIPQAPKEVMPPLVKAPFPLAFKTLTAGTDTNFKNGKRNAATSVRSNHSARSS